MRQECIFRGEEDQCFHGLNPSRKCVGGAGEWGEACGHCRVQSLIETGRLEGVEGVVCVAGAVREAYEEGGGEMAADLLMGRLPSDQERRLAARAASAMRGIGE